MTAGDAAGAMMLKGSWGCGGAEYSTGEEEVAVGSEGSRYGARAIGADSARNGVPRPTAAFKGVVV